MPGLRTTPDESGFKSALSPLQGALFIALAFMPGRRWAERRRGAGALAFCLLSPGPARLPAVPWNLQRSPDEMTRRIAKPVSALFLLLFLSLSLASLAQLAPPPLEPASTGGLAEVDRALAKLSTNKRLLVIGAHPDDEDTSLIALVSRGLGGDAAYLSLSRGEGGQNVIGPELGVGLGLLRSRELLASRAVDGGRQFFTRAFDFGYTRSLEETLRLWPKDVLVEDAVRVIRRFRPQVVVSVFPGVPHPNHGQHHAAGVTAYAAFPLPGDPQALPQLTAESLPPGTPQVLYRSTFFDPNSTTMTLSPRVIDPRSGTSMFRLP